MTKLFVNYFASDVNCGNEWEDLDSKLSLKIKVYSFIKHIFSVMKNNMRCIFYNFLIFFVLEEQINLNRKVLVASHFFRSPSHVPLFKHFLIHFK